MIKAIETSYKGYRFRSRLEARWAVFFDSLGIKWLYEHEGFVLSTGEQYLPDFYLPDLDVFAEVKGGDYHDESTRFYLAGKMNRWRDPILRQFYCVNPYIPNGHVNTPAHYEGSDIGEDIVENSLSAIKECDFLFAYISSLDCYGTLAEIGFATALGKPVTVAIDFNCIHMVETDGHGVLSTDLSEFVSDKTKLHGHTSVDQIGNIECHTHGKWQEFLCSKECFGEVWFAAEMASYGARVVADEAVMLGYFLELFSAYKIREDELKAKTLSLDADKTVVILRDIPQHNQSFRCFHRNQHRGGRFYFQKADDFHFHLARSARFEFNR